MTTLAALIKDRRRDTSGISKEEMVVENLWNYFISWNESKFKNEGKPLSAYRVR